jgi:transcriptional regulator of PTS gene
MDIDPRKKRRRLIFSQIRRSGPVARVDLAQDTEISQPTVTTITAELLRKGLIEEVTPEEPPSTARRGRPRIALQVRAGSHRVVGLKLADRSITAVLTDFGNTVLAERSVATRGLPLSDDEAGAAVGEMVQALAADAGLRPRDISAVGIGLPGVVDAATGTVAWSPVLKSRPMPLSEALGARLGLPVFVDNDANLVAVAEKFYGAGRAVSDFLVVTIEQGVGLGIVLKDEVYRGARGFAAEFGHTKVQPGGALCRCGQRGCLEAYVADYALLREASSVPALAELGGPAEVLAGLLRAARSGDGTARSIVGRAEKYFAIGLANLITLFDPQLIVLSGERTISDYLVAEDVLGSIRDFLHPHDAGAPEIVVHRWGNMMWARGAAAYAIDGVSERLIAELDRDAA